MPRFVKVYLLLAILVVSLILSIIAMAGSFGSLSLGKSSHERNTQDFISRHVTLKGPFIPEDSHNNNDHAKRPEQIPKPNGQPNHEEKSDDDKIFTFDPLKRNREISWEADLLNQKHSDDQLAVVEAMKHSWNAYRKYAWGADHLKPLTRTTQNWFHVGLTILDSLDTLILMGMKDELEDAAKWTEDTLTFDIYRDVNCFEMTIRALGGLLSAFHLTKRPVFLHKAVDVGDRLIHCFDSPSGNVPYSDVNLRTKTPRSPSWSPDSSLSEVSSVQLEFRDLTSLTQDKRFEETSFKASKHLHDLVMQRDDPLLPMFINPNNGRLTNSVITLGMFSRVTCESCYDVNKYFWTTGARGDSYYEYLIKQYLQSGIGFLRDDYLDSVDAIRSRLIQVTPGTQKLTYVAEILSKTSGLNPKMDHLVCFLPGTLALGYYHYNQNKPQGYRGHISDTNAKNSKDLWPDRFADHLVLAEELARTCFTMYNMTATGLSPEIVYFGFTKEEDEIYIRPADSHNLLRPEYTESLFYLYHITGNEMYRDQGRRVSDLSSL